MKKALAIVTILFVTILSTGLKPAEHHSNAIDENCITCKKVQDDSFYFYFTIDGVYSKERYAFVSRYMKYPGYKASGKTATEYQDEAEEGFISHLQANYKEHFPYNVNNVIRFSGTLTKYGSQSLKTYQEAISDRNYWISEQKGDGNKITEVNYAYYGS